MTEKAMEMIEKMMEDPQVDQKLKDRLNHRTGP